MKERERVVLRVIIVNNFFLCSNKCNRFVLRGVSRNHQTPPSRWNLFHIKGVSPIWWVNQHTHHTYPRTFDRAVLEIQPNQSSAPTLLPRKDSRVWAPQNLFFVSCSHHSAVPLKKRMRENPPQLIRVVPTKAKQKKKRTLFLLWLCL